VLSWWLETADIAIRTGASISAVKVPAGVKMELMLITERSGAKRPPVS